MDYTYVVKLPQYLETAYQAGEIFISGGVARNINTKQIVAHLEQVAPLANTLTALPTGNPNVVMVGMAIDLAKIAKDTMSNRQKINQILNLVGQLRVLSSVNIAMISINLGVNIVGFYLLINKLNQLIHRLDTIDNKLNAIITHESRSLFKETKVDIKDATTLVNILEERRFDGRLDSEIQRHLNRLETNIQDLIDRYKNQELINVTLDYILTAYNAYGNLLKAYITAKYLVQEHSSLINLRLRTFDNIKNQIISQQILTLFYEHLLLNQEKMLTEQEIDVILYIYKKLCQESYERVNFHTEILMKTSISKFKSWKQNFSPTEPIIWVKH